VVDQALDNAMLKEPVEERGAPACIRSDNGPGFVAKAVRDELLDIECFGTLAEAKVLGKEYRHGYNDQRPHLSLDCLPPRSSRGVAFWLIPLHQPEGNASPPSQPNTQTKPPATAGLSWKVNQVPGASHFHPSRA